MVTVTSSSRTHYGKARKIHVGGDGVEVDVHVGQHLLPHLADPRALHEEVKGCLHHFREGRTCGRRPQAAETGQTAPNRQDVVDQTEGRVRLLRPPSKGPEPPPHQRPRQVRYPEFHLGGGEAYKK